MPYELAMLPLHGWVSQQGATLRLHVVHRPMRDAIRNRFFPEVYSHLKKRFINWRDAYPPGRTADYEDKLTGDQFSIQVVMQGFELILKSGSSWTPEQAIRAIRALRLDPVCFHFGDLIPQPQTCPLAEDADVIPISVPPQLHLVHAA